jgi:succinate dehydrogenase flavin-adding protein (antitoxin of CptAB toxin-antitoxin module)
VLGYQDISGSKTMSFSSKHAEKLTDAEWNEMTALKDAIDHDITQVVPEKMEAFTEYFVRSLREKGG